MAFNGSARKDGNTAILINYVLKELQQEGIETELFQLAGQKIQGCMAEMKALIDRSGFVAKANGDILQRKLGAAVVAMRRGGCIHAFDTLNHFFLIGQMIVPGSSYWNLGIGRNKGEVEKDEEGIKTMKILGQNMAWLLKKMQS
jgi:multimeric flavodoxin WrbA